MPDGHLRKFDLLCGSLIGFILAFIAEITAVVFLHLFAPSPSLCRHSWAYSVDASTSQHASVFFAILECQAQLLGGLEVFGGDRGRDRWGVCSLDMGGIGSPASGFEGSRIEESIVDGEESLAYTVCDFIEVACSKLVGDQPIGC